MMDDKPRHEAPAPFDVYEADCLVVGPEGLWRGHVECFNAVVTGRAKASEPMQYIMVYPPLPPLDRD